MGPPCRAWAADSRAAGTGSPDSTHRSCRNLDSVSSQQPFLSEGRMMPPPLSQSMHGSAVDGPEKRTKKKSCPGRGSFTACRKSPVLDICTQEPRRVPSSADDGIKLKSRFSRGHAPREKHFSGRKCASKASARSGLHPFSEMLAFQRACRVSRHAQAESPLCLSHCFLACGVQSSSSQWKVLKLAMI